MDHIGIDAHKKESQSMVNIKATRSYAPHPLAPSGPESLTEGASLGRRPPQEPMAQRPRSRWHSTHELPGAPTAPARHGCYVIYALRPARFRAATLTRASRREPCGSWNPPCQLLLVCACIRRDGTASHGGAARQLGPPDPSPPVIRSPARARGRRRRVPVRLRRRPGGAGVVEVLHGDLPRGAAPGQGRGLNHAGDGVGIEKNGAEAQSPLRCDPNIVDADPRCGKGREHVVPLRIPSEELDDLRVAEGLHVAEDEERVKTLVRLQREVVADAGRCAVQDVGVVEKAQRTLGR